MSSGKSFYNNTRIVAISGGSGSGKTTLAKCILEAFGAVKVAILGQDSYYLDQSKNFVKDGGAVNFDHPSALDFSLMASHILALKGGDSIHIPVYDFVSHSRTKHIEHLDPHPIIIVDGTLILSQEELCGLFDYAIFLDVPEEVRFLRRLKRDVRERGRTEEGVREQFYSQVKPMHDQFVQPSQANANLTLTNNCNVETAIMAIRAKFGLS